MATAPPKLMTAEEFAALEIDAPVELVRGEVVEMPRPGMRHGVICNSLSYHLTAWKRESGDHYLVVADSGIITEHGPDTVRGPDLYLIQRKRLPDGHVIPGFLEIPPDLCVEVVSPHDLWKDVIAKVDEYLQAGVLEVWVIEPDERKIYVYRPDGPPRTFSEGQLIKSVAVKGLALDSMHVFQDVAAVL